MAAATSQIFMLSQQFEFGQLMVKYLCDQSGYVSIASFMVCVTTPAGQRLYLRIVAMELFLLRQIFSNLFMAVETELGLVALIKILVAGFAFTF